MKIAIGLVTALVIAGALIYLIGMRLPVKHTARNGMLFKVPAAQMWDVISDFQNYAQWRKEIVAVEKLPDINGHSVWKEVEKNGGGLQYETLQLQPGRELVRRIAGEGLPFGGTWTFTLTPHESGTQLTITEDGEIYNPVFRFVARYLMGYHKSMQTYFTDLEGRLGPSEICTS
jgi:uncharacterized protein YndB with AHSA1/START domain